MEFVYFTPSLNVGHRSDLSGFHLSMFHGEVNFAEDMRRIDEDLIGKQSLRIKTKNLFELAEVFMPGGNLVVSERIRDILALHCDVRFVLVEFEEVYNYPFQVGDNSYYDQLPPSWMKETISPAIIKKYECDAPTNDYFEVILP